MSSSTSHPAAVVPAKYDWRIIFCFACIYIIWGSTYLAIKYAIIAFPPIYMSCFRFVCASTLLILVGVFRREKLPPLPRLKTGALSGALLVFANSMVSVSEKWLSSSLAAVLIGSSPVWILLFHWLFFEGRRPTFRQLAGITIAVIGILFLSQQGESSGDLNHTILGFGLLLTAIVSWSFGTLIQRRAGKAPGGMFIFSGFQLLAGALIVSPLAFFLETLNLPPLADIPLVPILALLYLIVFGTLVGFSAYLWLSVHVEPSIVSTYALVNPLIAVWLGWFLANESVNTSMLFFSAFVLLGLYLVLFNKKR